MPRRICSQASQRHDQSIKVACAAIQGCITLRPPPGHTGAWPTKLYEFDDTFLPTDFISAYAQIELSAKLGGHGLRRWGRHIDQAFIGQWCLTIQSATKPRDPADLAGVTDGTLYYPVLNDVLKAAEDRRRILDAPGASDAGDIDLPECVTLAADVCDAWRSCVGASEKAGPTYAAWIDRCDGSIENVGHVVGTGPQDTAQKTLSESVLQNQVVELDAAMAADSSHGAQVRRANWCAYLCRIHL